VKGIEINAYAAELVRVSVWVGEIQWMRRNGFSNTTDPILDPLDTIECRDAILAQDGGQSSSDRSTEVAGHRNRQNDSFELPPLPVIHSPFRPISGLDNAVSGADWGGTVNADWKFLTGS